MWPLPHGAAGRPRPPWRRRRPAWARPGSRGSWHVQTWGKRGTISCSWEAQSAWKEKRHSILLSRCFLFVSGDRPREDEETEGVSSGKGRCAGNHCEGLMPARGSELGCQLGNRSPIGERLRTREPELQPLTSLPSSPPVPEPNLCPPGSAGAGTLMFRRPTLNEMPSAPLLTFITRLPPPPAPGRSCVASVTAK